MIFKDIQYCQKFKEIGGHHEKNVKAATFLTGLPLRINQKNLNLIYILLFWEK